MLEVAATRAAAAAEVVTQPAAAWEAARRGRLFRLSAFTSVRGWLGSQGVRGRSTGRGLNLSLQHFPLLLGGANEAPWRGRRADVRMA